MRSSGSEAVSRPSGPRVDLLHGTACSRQCVFLSSFQNVQSPLDLAVLLLEHEGYGKADCVCVFQL